VDVIFQHKFQIRQIKIPDYLNKNAEFKKFILKSLIS